MMHLTLGPQCSIIVLEIRDRHVMSSEGWKVALTKCRYAQRAREWASVHEFGRNRGGGPTPDTLAIPPVPKNTSVPYKYRDETREGEPRHPQ